MQATNTELKHAGIPLNKLDFICASISDYLKNAVHITLRDGYTILQCFPDELKAREHQKSLLDYLNKNS